MFQTIQLVPNPEPETKQQKIVVVAVRGISVREAVATVQSFKLKVNQETNQTEWRKSVDLFKKPVQLSRGLDVFTREVAQSEYSTSSAVHSQNQII